MPSFNVMLEQPEAKGQVTLQQLTSSQGTQINRRAVTFGAEEQVTQKRQTTAKQFSTEEVPTTGNSNCKEM